MEKTTRNLKGGEVLVAKFKGKAYKAAAIKTEEGIRIGLPDGRLFTSVSAAGTAIMGHACNGHRFWKVEVGETAKPAQVKKPKAKKAKGAAQPKPSPAATVAVEPQVIEAPGHFTAGSLERPEPRL